MRLSIIVRIELRLAQGQLARDLNVSLAEMRFMEYCLHKNIGEAILTEIKKP